MTDNSPELRVDDDAVSDAAGRPGPGSADGDPSLVLHEERLRMGLQHVATKRVRLRKYVVEEQASIPVTLRHEVVEVIEEPLTGADAVAVPGPLTGLGVGDGQEAAPTVIEMIVHREEPRIELDVVATERIRLTRYTVTDHVDVTREVARETAERIDEAIDQ